MVEHVSVIDPIFKEFRKHTDGLVVLNRACEAIQRGSDRMRVRVLRIEETNACSSTTFSNATCAVSSFNRLTKSGIVNFSIGTLFEDGMQDLKRYLDVRPCIPDDIPSRKALAKLLKFMNSSLECIKRPKIEDKIECEWPALLAQNLFAKLAADSKITLDYHYSKESVKTGDEQLVCPNAHSDQLQGTFGDTSFGCPDGWHGSVDIFLENIPITVTCKPDFGQSRERIPSYSADYGNELSVEDKADYSQLLSQCIVFSFLQRKQLGNPDVDLLVPSIGINASTAIVFLYDGKNDVLFESAKLDLFANSKELNVLTVVFLWLTLNYRCFCSGITRGMKCFKSNFRHSLGVYLEKYEQEVIKPFPRKSRTSVEDEEEKWAENFNFLMSAEGIQRKREIVGYTEI